MNCLREGWAGPAPGPCETAGSSPSYSSGLVASWNLPGPGCPPPGVSWVPCGIPGPPPRPLLPGAGLRESSTGLPRQGPPGSAGLAWHSARAGGLLVLRVMAFSPEKTPDPQRLWPTPSHHRPLFPATSHLRPAPVLPVLVLWLQRCPQWQALGPMSLEAGSAGSSYLLPV